MNPDSERNCGCCEGTDQLTPLPVTNRPGLDALNYRIGTHASFLESMQARLASLPLPGLDAAGKPTTTWPLAALTTRASSDPALAMLDAWATVADVLTFYQERIANEGYLRTATERRSILELGRLVGYQLRPGVSAGAHLAFTVETGFSGTIPAGTRAKTVPVGAELPQSFETTYAVEACDAWNELKQRQTEPQGIEWPAEEGIAPWTLYLDGTALNLKTGGMLVLEFPDLGLRAYRILSITENPAARRTAVTVALWGPPLEVKLAKEGLPEALTPGSLRALAAAISAAAGRPGIEINALLKRVAEALLLVFEQVAGDPSLTAHSPALRETTLAMQEIQDALTNMLAQLRSTTMIHRITADVSDWLARAVALLPDSLPAGGHSRIKELEKKSRKPGLDGLVPQLLRSARPGTIPPRTSFDLPRDHAALFRPSSDLLPQIITGFYPALRDQLYTAYNNAVSAVAQPVRVFAMRVTAPLFGHNALPVTVGSSGPLDRDKWLRWGTDQEKDDGLRLSLDREYETILATMPVSRIDDHLEKVTEQLPAIVAVQTPGQELGIFRVDRVDTISRSDYGLSGKTTIIDLEGDQQWFLFQDYNDTEFDRAIRGTTVFTGSEQLTRAEVPITADTGGNVIELNSIYDGLQPGRWIIVAGERTDLDGTTGVRAGELVMLSAVEHIAQDLTTGAAPYTRLTLANQLRYTFLRDTVTIYGNVVEATHGETRQEVLGSGDATQPFQTFSLQHSPLTYLAAPTPSGVLSTLAVRVNDVLWHEAGNLFALQGGQRGFITRADDQNKTSIIFGNGHYGARPPTGVENLRAVYRSGIGALGNVHAGQIRQLATRPPGVKSVFNPMPSSGGADPESMETARANLPNALMCLDRLVSLQDYEDFARSFAGIGKAAAARVSDGQGELIYLTIAGDGDIPITKTSPLYRNLVAAIRRFGDPYQPFTIEMRQAILLVVSAGVRIHADYAWEKVAPKIRTALLDVFSFTRRALGQAVHLSEVIRVIQSVEGVLVADVDILDGFDESQARNPALLAAVLERLGGGEAAEPSVPQPRPNIPARLSPRGPCPEDAPQIAYLNPTIPTTLILEEIR